MRVLDLVPIQRPDERALARSLLGGDISDEVLDAVCEGVGRQPACSWRRGWRHCSTPVSYGATAGAGGSGATVRVPLPEALERLIRSRADRLSLPAREVMVAASVLGQEIEHSALGVVSELDAELDDAVAEVVSAGLIVEVPGQPEPRYRFRHALIREATYGGLLRSQRRQLHARAAWELEARSAGRLDEVAAVLGGHFAAAGQADRAAHYLELAGDRAARIFANDEAIGLYRQALAVIDGDGKSGRSRVNEFSGMLRSQRVWLCAGSSPPCSCWSTGSAKPGRWPLTGWPGRQSRTRCGRRGCSTCWAGSSGRTSVWVRPTDALEAAEKLIGPCGLDDDQERVDIWLAVQVDKAWVARRGNEVDHAASILASVRGLTETRGSPMVVADVYGLLASLHILERRYRVDADIVEEHRRAANGRPGHRRDEMGPGQPRDSTVLFDARTSVRP